MKDQRVTQVPTLVISRCLLLLAAISFFLVGCAGVPSVGEKQARKDQESIRKLYRPSDQKPNLADLTTESSLAEFMRFAMLNQPKVEAAYYNWMSSIENITTARSLPDPRLTFEMYIQNVVMSLMPGLMMDLPWPGKLGARAEISSAESSAKYFLFEASVLQAAFEFKRSYYQLYFLQERIRVNKEMLNLISGFEKIARAQNEVGRITLQDVLRAQMEKERLSTEIANLKDSRNSLLAQLKAALGLASNQPDPPMPERFESTRLDLDSERLFEIALQRNPRLRSMEAEVRQAEAAIKLAYKGRYPDFNVGLEADVKAAPIIWNPQFGITLPIWKDKIAAQIAGAQASKNAAQARLSAEEISLAVEFADKMFSYHESSRNLALLRERLLLKGQQSLEAARSGYLSGQIAFFNLIDAERSLLGFKLAEVEAQTQCEKILAELSLMILGVPPDNAPILNLPTKDLL